MYRIAASVAGVALFAACGGGDSLPGVEGPTSPRLEVDGGEFYFDPERIAVAAGDVEVVLRNVGKVVHDIRIEGIPTLLLEAAAGETESTTWTLEEGRYEMYCSLPGHRAGGMEGIVEVR
ncbi:MAG TPA: plastocyanin/azurin family copper-binding protein [Acidimicrobiia bacterium]|nr:plastocyanin/azurin family copper-binding protein [Acidimicrobiia bacterium]